MRDQLGLKLEAQLGVADGLKIESVDKVPTRNLTRTDLHARRAPMRYAGFIFGMPMSQDEFREPGSRCETC